MRIELLGFLSLVLGGVLLLAPPRMAFYVIVLSTLFGAAAAFYVPGLGGASVLVPSLLLAFYCLRLFMAHGERSALAAVSSSSPGIWLLLLTVYGVFSALFFPRILDGVTETMIVLRSSAGHRIIDLVPLSFSSNNITQTVYALGGLFCFAFTFAYLKCGGTARNVVNAMLVLAMVNLAFALLDVITYRTGTAYLFDSIRTANYALLTGSEKAGFKRISGTFPEASAFAGFTVVLFAFTASLWLDRMRSLTTGIVAGLLLLALLLSTSTTALVSLAMAMIFLSWRALPISRGGRATGRPSAIALALFCLPLGFMLVLVLAPDFARGVQTFLDETLYSKLDSQSARERMQWNAVAFQVFLDTWGWGAGLGSARASSYALVLLSNVGLLGTILFALFVGNTLMMRSGSERYEYATMRAAKAGIFAGLCEAMISGTVYDLGLLFFILAGAAAAMRSVPVGVQAFRPGIAEIVR
ncbi:hypothetical protein [uncultured Nitratireductor sp.]|uniref:hypothetical protein n=1 Tax=uncultured Nitratireductor sp. TaxID=520953 RepID=UPI0025FACDF2|nr:hypothetical protein [uncultured Nitratireductor sp.]